MVIKTQRNYCEPFLYLLPGIEQCVFPNNPSTALPFGTPGALLVLRVVG